MLLLYALPTAPLNVEKTEPPAGSTVFVPRNGCANAATKCYVDEGTACWEVGRPGGNFTGAHQMRRNDDGELSKEIYSLHFSATFSGSYSELSICATENSDIREISVACFANEGLQRSPIKPTAYMTIIVCGELVVRLL